MERMRDAESRRGGCRRGRAEGQRSACGDAKSSPLLRTLLSWRDGNAVLATSPCGSSYTSSTYHPLPIAWTPSHCRKSLRKCTVCCDAVRRRAGVCCLPRRQKTAQSEGSANSNKTNSTFCRTSTPCRISRQGGTTYLPWN